MRTALLILFAVQAAAQPDRFGLPACAGADRELAHRSGSILCYDSSRKVALWTAHQLTPQPTTGVASRPNRFRRDTMLAGPTALDSDFRHSGYSRGHLVPAADLADNPEALADSFLLSNAIPQNQSLNAGKWRILEQALRRLAGSVDAMYVLTGPVFCETTATIGPNQVAVPCRLYKVALAVRGSELTMFAAILPNDHNPTEPLAAFATTVDDVQRLTRLDFSRLSPPKRRPTSSPPGPHCPRSEV